MDGKTRILIAICLCILITAVSVIPATATETEEKCDNGDEFTLRWDDRQEVIGSYTVEFADYDIGSIGGRPASALLKLYKNGVYIKSMTVTNAQGQGQDVFEYPEPKSSADDPDIRLVMQRMTDINLSTTGFDDNEIIGRPYSPAVMFKAYTPCLNIEITTYNSDGKDVDNFESDKLIRQFVGETAQGAVINARINVKNVGSLDAKNVNIGFSSDGLVIVSAESTDRVSKTETGVSYRFTEDIIAGQTVVKNAYLKFPSNLTKESFRLKTNVSRIDADGSIHTIGNDKVVKYTTPNVVKTAPKSTVWGENTYAYLSIENVHDRPYDQIVVYDTLPNNFIFSFNLSEKDTNRSSWIYDVWRFAGFAGTQTNSGNSNNNTSKPSLMWVYHPDRELNAWGWDAPSLSRWVFDPMTGIWKWNFAGGKDELVYDKNSNTVRWTISLRANEVKSIAYPMMVNRPGEYRVPRARATWERGGERYMEYSAGEIIKMEGPFVIVEKRADLTTVAIGEEVTISTTISSIGTIPANVNFEDFLPDNSTLTKGKLENYTGHVKPGEVKSFTYTVRMDSPGQNMLPRPHAEIVGRAYKDNIVFTSIPTLTVIKERPPVPVKQDLPKVAEETIAIEGDEGVADTNVEAEQYDHLREVVLPGFSSFLAISGVLLIWMLRRK